LLTPVLQLIDRLVDLPKDRLHIGVHVCASCFCVAHSEVLANV
jgi:hypothetical protein